MKRGYAFLSTLVLATVVSMAACSQSLAQTARLKSETPAAASAPTAVPALVPYSGTVVSNSGKALAGEASITFLVFKDEQGGESLFTETQTVAIDSTGHYKVQLGATNPSGLPSDLFSTGEARWLEVQIAGEPAQPRALLTSVPYALKAADAATLGGLPASAFALAAHPAMTPATSGTITGVIAGRGLTGGGTSGTITLNVNTSQIPLLAANNSFVGNEAVSGTIAASSTGTFAIQGALSSAAGNAVAGKSTSTTGNANGVYGSSASPNGAGVSGNNFATTGSAYGVTGGTSSTTSYASGVNGYEGAKTGTVFGVGGGTSSTGPASAGVSGYEGATTGYVFGVSGTTPSAGLNASGVLGNEQASKGQVYGVTGINSSAGPFAAGVNGYEGSPTGYVYGVIGDAVSTTTGAVGVLGNEEATTGQVYGVVGDAYSTTNYSAGVTGSESALTGAVYGVSGGSSSSTNGAAGVNGNAVATTGQVYGVNGATGSTGTGAAGVDGYEGATTGVVYGVNGSTSSTTNGAAAVNGYEGAATGTVFGVQGNTSSSGNGAAGVWGNAASTTGNVYGVSGTANSPTGAGVNGVNNALSGTAIGVLGTTASVSTGATAVEGIATSTTGDNYGVVGMSNSFDGYGVFGSSPYKAVSGWSQSCNGGACTVASGIAGEFITGVGGTILSGSQRTADTITNTFTVYSDGDAFLAGNLTVLGNVSKGGGSFKIDDPLDPANKYLSHSFVESPDMMNVYNGNVTTDKLGRATVDLPEYFASLNRDFRYQLTVVGKFAQAIVATEIDHNKFVIRTSKPLVKVSWQVTGIRKDAYANANRIPVEENKPADERGYYLHPEVFNQPPSKGIVAAHQPEAPSKSVAQLIGVEKR